MRLLRLCIVAFASAAISSNPAFAQTRMDAQYAATLRDFNPALGRATSIALAERLIVEADAQGLDARLLVALIAIESNWHPRAISQAGARGLGQLMPSTADLLGVDPMDAAQNIHAVAQHLRTLLNLYARYDARTRYALTLGAYNAGSGAVTKWGGVPPYPQTRHYIRAVILLWRQLAGGR